MQVDVFHTRGMGVTWDINNTQTVNNDILSISFLDNNRGYAVGENEMSILPHNFIAVPVSVNKIDLTWELDEFFQHFLQKNLKLYLSIAKP
jgi:hypothetical protein